MKHYFDFLNVTDRKLLCLVKQKNLENAKLKKNRNIAFYTL